MAEIRLRLAVLKIAYASFVTVLLGGPIHALAGNEMTGAILAGLTTVSAVSLAGGFLRRP
jgi:hypothetical protein